MKETRHIMGMPISIEICDGTDMRVSEKVFSYFSEIDKRFSIYKAESEISRINRGEISSEEYSEEMKEVFALAEKTKEECQGYFDITTPEGVIDPSGIVKGFAIYRAGAILHSYGYENFYIEAGGDIESRGHNSSGTLWKVGIKDPFYPKQIIKIITPRGCGVATSGTYERGQHIYDPIRKIYLANDIISMTVLGANVYEADRFATGAFAMGRRGIDFIEDMPDLEGYSIDRNGMATMTTGFEKFVSNK